MAGEGIRLWSSGRFGAGGLFLGDLVLLGLRHGLHLRNDVGHGEGFVQNLGGFVVLASVLGGLTHADIGGRVWSSLHGNRLLVVGDCILILLSQQRHLSHGIV